MCPAQADMTDNDIVRRGYLNVIRNPQGGVVSKLFGSWACVVQMMLGIEVESNSMLELLGY